MPYVIKYLTPDGESLDLYHTDQAAYIIAGGITGLVGKINTEVFQSPAISGQTVLSRTVEPMDGTITLFIDGTVQTASKIVSKIRRSFSQIEYGILTIENPDLGTLYTPVRLNGAIEAPEQDPHVVDYIFEMVIPVISDSGLWYSDMIVNKTSVDVVNWGEFDIFPDITWRGKGGTVTLPSGATFTLPDAPLNKKRTMSLNASKSLVVRDENGDIDEGIWKKVWGVIPEGVAPGNKGTYKIPSTASISYSVGVCDPWQ